MNPFCIWGHLSEIMAAIVKTARYFEEQVLRKRPTSGANGANIVARTGTQVLVLLMRFNYFPGCP